VNSSSHQLFLCNLQSPAGLSLKTRFTLAIACSNNFEENTKEGRERENRAIKAYAKFAKEAPEIQLKQFFKALVEIETDHLELHAENLKK
jgi:rubrerythrin